jgi:hypothetical protein
MYPLDVLSNFSAAMRKNGYTQKPIIHNFSESGVECIYSNANFKLTAQCQADKLCFDGVSFPEGNNISSNGMDPDFAAKIICRWIELCEKAK